MKNNSASNIHPERSALGVNHSTLLSEIDLKEIVEIAKRAGDAIMEIYDKDFTVEYKDDKSPLTEADIASHNIIVEGLQTLELKNTEHGARNTQHFPFFPKKEKKSRTKNARGGNTTGASTPSTGPRSSSRKTASSRSISR
jgi:ribosomal protein S17E